jgi:hypothetical protein
MPSSHKNSPPPEGKSPPNKTIGLVIHLKNNNLPANGSRVLFSNSFSFPTGCDGETGYGTSLQNITFSTIKKQLTPVKTHTYIYILYSIYPDYHKIRISEQGGLIGGLHMFIHREGPSQSSVAKHFWECGS